MNDIIDVGLKIFFTHSSDWQVISVRLKSMQITMIDDFDEFMLYGKIRPPSKCVCVCVCLCV